MIGDPSRQPILCREFCLRGHPMQRVLHRNIKDARAIDVTLGFVKPTNKVTTTINQHKRKYPQEQVRTQSENKQTAWSQALLQLIGRSNGRQFSRPTTDRSKATQCNLGLLLKRKWKLLYTRDTGYLDSKKNVERDSPWNEPFIRGSVSG